MGTIRFGGVRFQVFSDDHLPRHVHARYGGIVVIVDIWGGVAARSKRKHSVRPVHAKRSDIAYVVRAARMKLAELNQMWEDTHGD